MADTEYAGNTHIACSFCASTMDDHEVMVIVTNDVKSSAICDRCVRKYSMEIADITLTLLNGHNMEGTRH